MADTVDPARRAAATPIEAYEGEVTLINGFAVPEGRDAGFRELWAGTSGYFRRQPGFLSLRLHRALSPDAPHRFVNVARWRSAAEFRAAHGTDEFRRLVGDPAWREFPSSPALYEVAVAHDAEPVSA